MEKVEVGSQLGKNAGAIIEELVVSVRSVTQIMSEISATSGGQQAGIEQVNQAIVQMEMVTQQNAALVEEAAAPTQALKEQASRLAESVSIFKLSGNDFHRVCASIAGVVRQSVDITPPDGLPR